MTVSINEMDDAVRIQISTNPYTRPTDFSRKSLGRLVMRSAFLVVCLV